MRMCAVFISHFPQLLAIIAFSDLGHGLEIDCNQVASLVSFKLLLMMVASGDTILIYQIP